MKTKLTLVVILTCITCATFAQRTVKESNPNWLKKQALFEKLKSRNVHTKTTKTRAQDDRLIAEVYEESAVEDSTTYSYSANRGSELIPEYYVYFEDINYDRSDYYDFTATPILQDYSNCTYNVLNQLVSQLDSSYDWTSYEPDFRVNNTFNTNNQLAENQFDGWDGSMFVNGFKTTNTYNGNNLASEISQNWNGTAWENSFKTDYVYNGSNQVEYTEYSYTSSTWNPSNRLIRTFNANNQALTEEYLTYQGNAWEPFQKDSFSYNGNNEVILVESVIWNNNQWENSDRALITWANNRPTVVEFDDWNGTAWDKLERYSYTYNTNGYPTSETSDVWNGTAYVYDPNNDSYKIRYYYESYNNSVAVNDVDAKFGAVKIYPNPANDILNIEVEKSDNSLKEIVVLDMTGMLVSKTTVNNQRSIQVNLGGVAAGTYIVNINSAEGTSYSTKITKQ